MWSTAALNSCTFGILCGFSLRNAIWRHLYNGFFIARTAWIVDMNKSLHHGVYCDALSVLHRGKILWGTYRLLLSTQLSFTVIAWLNWGKSVSEITTMHCVANVNVRGKIWRQNGKTQFHGRTTTNNKLFSFSSRCARCRVETKQTRKSSSVSSFIQSLQHIRIFEYNNTKAKPKEKAKMCLNRNV